MSCNHADKIPGDGYRLRLWDITGYRATAIAYMQRENLSEVEHINGRFYTLNQLKEASINYNF